jgi:hypothetical protein
VAAAARRRADRSGRSGAQTKITLIHKFQNRNTVKALSRAIFQVDAK